jgi:spermidine synthase
MDTELIKRIEAAGYIVENACSSDIISLYPCTSKIWSEQTDYAKAVIADCKGLGRTLFLDGEVQSAESDEAIYHESLVHPVMISVPSACRESVLIIGGGEGATAREVLKWPDVKHVTWIDIDGDLVDACLKHLGWVDPAIMADPRLEFSAEDVREFFKHNTRTFDVVIIDLPDPDTDDEVWAQETLQNTTFWLNVWSVVARGGAFVTHVGPVRRGLRSEGLEWTIRAAASASMQLSLKGAYHTVIPSFTDDWGFLMSCKLAVPEEWPPIQTRFLKSVGTLRYLFTWP